MEPRLGDPPRLRSCQGRRVDLDIKGIRHYTAASSSPRASISATPPPDSGIPAGAATTLKHYADPVSEVDRRAAAYLAVFVELSAAERRCRAVKEVR